MTDRDGTCSPELPADTQQDAERERAAEIIGNILLASTQSAWEDLAIPPRRWAQQAVRELAEAGLLAARPSADTETVDRVQGRLREIATNYATGTWTAEDWHSVAADLVLLVVDPARAGVRSAALDGGPP